MSNPTALKLLKSDAFRYDIEAISKFRHDCDALLNNFASLKSSNFKTFKQLFTKTGFIAIYKHVVHMRTTITFTELCFKIIKRYFDDELKLIRLGAFYLMYTLYFKQPIKDAAKIRLNADELAVMQSMLTFFRRHQFHAPICMMRRLQLAGALYFNLQLDETDLNRASMRRLAAWNRNQQRGRTSERRRLARRCARMLAQPPLRGLAAAERRYEDMAHAYAERNARFCPFASGVAQALEGGAQTHGDAVEEFRRMEAPATGAKRKRKTQTL